MATPVRKNSRRSLAMEKTGQWVFSDEIPTDVVVEVGEARFALHKFMLVAKSNHIRTLILKSKEADSARLDLSGIPGGPEIFEKTAKFCYGFNFEITVHNVAALNCAAKYLQMTDKYCDNNLAGRTEDFLSQVALTSLSGATVVLKSCEELLPTAEDLGIVQRCVDVASAKACVEANFPSRSPPNWWAEEFIVLGINFFGRIIASMKSRGAKGLTLATAIITYCQRSLDDFVHKNHSENGITKSPDWGESSIRTQQRQIVESIVALLPSEKSAFPISFLCCLLRTATFLSVNNNCKNELEKRISAILENVTVDDLLVLSFNHGGERMFDLESVRRIISEFVEKEKSVGDFREICSTAMQRVAKTVDAYLAEIAIYAQLSIARFNGIATLVPKVARKIDDDLYRAIDIYLKAHPDLDEIAREKVCSVIDPLKLSYEARVHASRNKRLPLQSVLHALYYDQLKLRSNGPDNDHTAPNAMATRNQVQADASLGKEIEALRNEVLKMNLYIKDMQKNQGTSSKSSVRKPTFFLSMSKTLGKLNPFKNGSKDTSNIEDGVVDLNKSRRRFSIA